MDTQSLWQRLLPDFVKHDVAKAIWLDFIPSFAEMKCKRIWANLVYRTVDGHEFTKAEGAWLVTTSIPLQVGVGNSIQSTSQAALAERELTTELHASSDLEYFYSYLITDNLFELPRSSATLIIYVDFLQEVDRRIKASLSSSSSSSSSSPSKNNSNTNNNTNSTNNNTITFPHSWFAWLISLGQYRKAVELYYRAACPRRRRREEATTNEKDGPSTSASASSASSSSSSLSCLDGLLPESPFHEYEPGIIAFQRGDYEAATRHFMRIKRRLALGYYSEYKIGDVRPGKCVVAGNMLGVVQLCPQLDHLLLEVERRRKEDKENEENEERERLSESTTTTTTTGRVNKMPLARLLEVYQGEELAVHLVHRLQDVGGPMSRRDPVFCALVNLGQLAVPALKQCIKEDTRLSRRCTYWRIFVPLRTVLGVRDIARDVLRAISEKQK
jgi:hypothetical protein